MCVDCSAEMVPFVLGLFGPQSSSMCFVRFRKLETTNFRVVAKNKRILLQLENVQPLSLCEP